MIRITVRHAGQVGVLVAATVLLVGCADGNYREADGGATVATTSAASDREAYNNADVTFVQGLMRQQHGALALSQLVPGRAGDPRVVELATRIEAAQQSQVDAMTLWLQEWGEPLLEEAEIDEHGPADLSDGRAMGGVSTQELAATSATTGAQFDRQFLTLMLEQHRTAVDMARTEIAAGSYPDAIALAREIEQTQTAEIDEMEALLAELGQ